MKISLDNGACWFDPSQAIEFAEASDWDGSNWISRATGGQWLHQTLYYTSRGAWVLKCSSQWEGQLTSHELVARAEAVAWLIAQGHADSEQLAKLPKDVQDALRQTIATVEV